MAGKTYLRSLIRLIAWRTVIGVSNAMRVIGVSGLRPKHVRSVVGEIWFVCGVHAPQCDRSLRQSEDRLCLRREVVTEQPTAVGIERQEPLIEECVEVDGEQEPIVHVEPLRVVRYCPRLRVAGAQQLTYG